MWYFSRFDYAFSDLYNEGIDLYKSKNYKAALQKFIFAISKFPDKYQAYYNAGLCELKLESYVKAQEHFELALKLKPNDYDTIYNLGYIALSLKDYNRAKKLFLSILSDEKEESDLLFNLGYIENQKDNLAAAKDYMYKATQISPEKKAYKKVYQDILEIYFNQTNDMNLVTEMLDLSLELLVVYPDDENIIYRTALAYAQLGDWENSVNYCERLYNKNPNSYKACNQFGLALFCKGEMHEAIEMYEHAIEIAPNEADTYINLVYAYDKSQDETSAINLANEIIAKFPGRPAADLAQDYLARKEEERREG